MTEQWKPVAGSPGYEISDQGRVRSLDRTIQQRSRYGELMTRVLKGQMLTPRVCRNGYLAVQLGKSGKAHLVHRLVAVAFVPSVDQTLQVNHKNGQRADNRAVNLDWLTCSDNHRHSYRELSRKEHALTRPVIVGGQHFPSELAAAKALGVVAGSIASAARRGHLCRGKEVFYA